MHSIINWYIIWLYINLSLLLHWTFFVIILIIIFLNQRMTYSILTHEVSYILVIIICPIISIYISSIVILLFFFITLSWTRPINQRLYLIPSQCHFISILFFIRTHDLVIMHCFLFLRSKHILMIFPIISIIDSHTLKPHFIIKLLHQCLCLFLNNFLSIYFKLRVNRLMIRKHYFLNTWKSMLFYFGVYSP